MSASKSTPQTRPGQLIVNGNALHSLARDEVFGGDDFLDDEDHEDNTYKPRPQLPTPFISMRTLEQLMSYLENDVLDIDPEYQREMVWTADRMTGLINSLMESFYIPPIILNRKPQKTQEGGKALSTLVCVDGKQRLSSVRAFIKGMIPCHDHRGEKWWFSNSGTIQRKKVFSAETQKMFLSKEFVAFEFSDLSAEQEEDLFARVQMGVQLSLAEKMRASTGPWQELAKLFVADFPTVYSLLKDCTRAKDFQLTLACFSQIVEVKYPSTTNGVPTLKTNHVSLPKLLGHKKAVDDDLKSHLASIWNTLKDLIEEDHDVFTNGDKYLRGVQTFAPVEMVAVTVLISMYLNTRSIQLLLGDIKALRIGLREHFTDLLLNASEWRFVWGFIEDLEAIRGTVDGNTTRKFLGQSSKPLPSGSFAHPSLSTALPGALAQIEDPSRKVTLSILPRWDEVPIKKEEVAPDSRPRKRQRTDSSSVNSLPTMTASSPNTPAQPRSCNSNLLLRESPPERPSTSSLPMPSSFLGNSRLSSSNPQTSKELLSPFTNSKPCLTKSTNQSPPSQKLSSKHQPPGQDSVVVPTPSSAFTAESSAPLSAKKPQQSQLLDSALHGPSRIALWPSLSSTAFPTATKAPAIPQARKASPAQQNASGMLSSIDTRKQRTKADRPSSLDRSNLTTPFRPSTPMTGLASQASATKTPRRTPTRPSPAQLDGAIDLTNDSDPEEQRQTLLLAFKGKSPRKEPGRDPAGASPASGVSIPAATMQRRQQTQKTQAAELPEGFNPYAKFLKNQDPRPPAL